MGKTLVTLASGREMPLVGFGLWKVPRETAAETVYNVSGISVYICNKRHMGCDSRYLFLSIGNQSRVSSV